MRRELNAQIIDKVNKEVLISGWINARRNMGKIVFLDMRDRSAILQVVCVPSELTPESQEILSSLRPEFCLQIKGVVQKRGAKQINPDMVTGEVELLAKEITVLSRAQTLPYDLEADLNMETYLNLLPFNLRAPRQRAIFKIQSALIEGYRQYLLDNGFTEFQCPKLVGGATEGGANVFHVDYFGKKAFLAQSPQFYKQMMVGVFERVFSTGNVYRAEEHDTNRHINEYTSLDFEMGFISDYTEVAEMVYGVIRAMIEKVKEWCPQEIKLLRVILPEMPETAPMMKLKEAQKILEDEFGEKGATQEPDFEPHQEKMVGEYAKKKFNSDFIFITHYPTKKRPMYTMPDASDPEYTLSFDLLFRGTEIVTGGQRIHDYEMLCANMKKFGLNPDDFQYYLNAFKYGMPPEGGMAVGLERMTWQLLQLDNIKKATLFPRDRSRIDEVLK